MKLTNSQWGQSLRSPPILIQVLGLALGTLVVAQIVALILSMIFVPTPRHYALEDIAAALRQTEGTGRDTRFDRHVEPGPPDFSARGWFVSESARRQLAGMMKRPVNQIALGFYTRLPVGGTVDIVPPAQALPADAKRISTSAVEGNADGGWASAQSLRPAALFVPTSSDLPGLVSDGATPIGLQQPPGGMPGGGMPGGGFPGGAPGGGMNEGPMGNGFPGRDGMGRTMPRDRGMPDRRSGEVPGGGVSSSRPEGTPTARSNRDAVWDQPIRNNGGGRSQGYGPSDPGGSRLGAPQAGASGARDGMAGAPDRAAGPDRAAPRGMGQATPRFDNWSTQPLSSWPVQTQPSRRSGPSAPPITDAPVAPEEASPAPRSALPQSDAAAPPPALSVPDGSIAVPAETTRARSTQLEAPIGTPVPIQRRPEGLSDWSPAPFVEGDFIAAMRRPDGRWVTVAPRAEGFPNSWQRQLALWFLLSLLLVAPLAWAFARRIVGPLNDFARTADMLGRDPGAAVLPLDGPAEIGRAAHAFNQMQSRLRSFVDDRTAMIGAISHDLRTPLTRLRFRLEDVPDEQREDLLDEVIEMEDMISSVLAFMRDASIPNARERRDLAELVEDVVEDAALIGDVRTARVEPAIVDIDALGMRRVLNNLMTNALKYGGGHARVALHVEDDQAIADIIDQGPGIPPGEVERAFEPFYRSAAAEASGREGSGLGLAVCRSIARAHGGDVELFHSPDGFIARVRLPLAYGLETRAA